MQAVPSDNGHPVLLPEPRVSRASRSGRAVAGAALVSVLLGVAEFSSNRSELSTVRSRAATAPSLVTPRASVAPAPAPRHRCRARLSGDRALRPRQHGEVDPDHHLYVPQYPLWTDGATKRRFVRLPPGGRIDASKPEAWAFPVGTRFWKEFSFSGRPVETRLIERLPDGEFRYATYVWDAARGDAFLAPEAGVRAAAEIRAGIEHDVPSVSDCRACHEGRRGRVLGFNALQLSPDRDPLAANREVVPPGALDLDEVARRGWLANVPPRAVDRAPRIAASSAKGRAALGYLFGNCARCHNPDGPLAELDFDLDQAPFDADGEARTRRSVVLRPSHFSGRERTRLRSSPARATDGERALLPPDLARSGGADAAARDEARRHRRRRARPRLDFLRRSSTSTVKKG